MSNRILKFISLGTIVALLIFIGCKKDDKNQTGNTKSAWKLSPGNIYEKPLSEYKDTNSSMARKGSIQSYSCGSSLNGSYGGTGYYMYPAYTLDLSNTSLGATVSIALNSYDIPNRFTVKDNTGNVVASTGWMGYVNYQGPWGMSLSTAESQTISFTKYSSSPYTLTVETQTNGYSDSWDATVSCVLPATLTATYAGVTITYETGNHILKFNSINDVDTVLNKLEADYDAYNDNYDSQYPNYTADQLDSLDSVNNFDEYKTVRDFENLFPGYTSQRMNLENTENTWLANSFTGTDPDTLDYTVDDFENTIFNNNYQFKIGTDVYEMRSDGLYINGTFQARLGYKTGRLTNGCFSGRATGFFYPPGTNKRYKLKAAIHSIIFRSTAKGKVVSFKQKSSGGWKRSRTEMAVTAGGNIYTSQCVFNFNFSNRKPAPSGYMKRRQLKVWYRQYGAGGQIIYKTMSKEYSAAFELPNGYSAVVQLQ